MKNKTHFTTAVLLSLVLFITLGCQLASNANAAPGSTPASNSAPAEPPAQTSALTPTPKLDLSSAVLRLEDLPPGFEEFDPDELGTFADDFSDGELQPEEVFFFMNSQDFQMIFGFNFLLAKSFDRAAFDMGISQPEMTLPAFINGMGSENVQDEKILAGFEDVGEKQIGMTMVANMEGVPFQVDVLMFRRDIVGAMVMTMVLEGESPNITLHEIGLILDQHIQTIE